MLCIGFSQLHLFSFKYFNGAKCLIYINLCTFHVNKTVQDCNDISVPGTRPCASSFFFLLYDDVVNGLRRTPIDCWVKDKGHGQTWILNFASFPLSTSAIV